MPWTAAIGRLDIAGGRPCTAVLVASDLIVTAAHCLFQGAAMTVPEQLSFHLNLGAQPDFGRFRISAVRALGGEIRDSGEWSAGDIAADWALLRIAPPPRNVRPVPLAVLPPSAIIAELARGAGLFTAGYGYGSLEMLRPHARCRIIDGAANGLGRHPGMLVTNCIIRIGDSGGPIALIDRSGVPQLVGIFTGFGLNAQTGLSFGSNAGNFAAYLDDLLISQWQRPSAVAVEKAAAPG